MWGLESGLVSEWGRTQWELEGRMGVGKAFQGGGLVVQVEGGRDTG